MGFRREVRMKHELECSRMMLRTLGGECLERERESARVRARELEETQRGTEMLDECNALQMRSSDELSQLQQSSSQKLCELHKGWQDSINQVCACS